MNLHYNTWYDLGAGSSYNEQDSKYSIDPHTLRTLRVCVCVCVFVCVKWGVSQS